MQNIPLCEFAETYLSVNYSTSCHFKWREHAYQEIYYSESPVPKHRSKLVVISQVVSVFMPIDLWIKWTCSHCRLNLISSMNCLSKKGGSKLKLGLGRRLPIPLAVLIIIVTYACTNTKYHTNNCWKIYTYSSLIKYVWYNLDGLLSIISVFLPNY